MTQLIALVAGIVLVHAACPAHASPPSPPAAFHADAEIDPTAYALGGHSLHVGLGWRRFRLDLGNFAIDVPRFVHGNDDFDLSISGFGVKLQWFPLREQTGLFAGIDSNVARVRVDRRDSDRGSRSTQVSAGVHVGYRFDLPAGFYATPWIGVGYEFGADDVTLDGATFEANPITVFPAIHLGYRFR